MLGTSGFWGRSAVALFIIISLSFGSAWAAGKAANPKVIQSGNLNWHLGGSCPEGSHEAEYSEWETLVKDKFTGARKKQNVKAFTGKRKGNAAYFSIAGEKDRALVLDLTRGSIKLAKPPIRANVTKQCVTERDLYAEKNISRKDLVMTDPRDGQKYKVEIRDNKAWMTSNLKFSIQSAKQCFLEDTVFCKKHGRFFTYNEAKKACPTGWHLPDDGEWRDFQKDWSKLNWNNLGVGGCRDWDEYCDEGATGHYWSSTSIKKNTGRAWEFRRTGKSINRTDESTHKGLYVRCVATLE